MPWPAIFLAGSELVAEPGYAGVPSRSSDELQAQWTPDGTALVFAATVNLHEAALGPIYYHLYEVSADGGEPRTPYRQQGLDVHRSAIRTRLQGAVLQIQAGQRIHL